MTLPLRVATALALLVLVAGCPKPTPPSPLAHFALRGLHADVTCTGCHGERLEAEPTTCAACHEPDRPASHFDGECASCHSEDGWGFAVADHSFFPLEFGHDGPTCLDCHEEGNYAAADPTCTSCHTRPTGHFEGTCDSCHDIRDWTNAVFAHRGFPIPHEGYGACADCHPQAGANDYDAFTCTDCHAHRRPDMDDEHLGEVSGYVYASSACLDCHPDGDD